MFEIEKLKIKQLLGTDVYDMLKETKCVLAGDKYYKIVYSYYSHDGYNYEDADVYEVVPVERLVTFYE